MTPAAGRIHSLDAVRALAMMLGIFLHTALPYTLPGFPWPVFDQSRSLALTVVLFVIHAFRMPAFFLVAGFFGRILHDRLGLRAFVRHRARRILLPLIAFWILLFPLIRFAWAWSYVHAVSGARPVGFAQAFAYAFDRHLLPAALGFAHLWFLYYLLIVYAAFLLFRAFVLRFSDSDRTLRAKIDAQIRSLVGSPMELPALVVPTALLLVPMRSWGIDSPDASLIPQLRSVLLYTAFFSYGWLLARQPALIDSYRLRWRRYPIIAAVALVPQLALLYLVTRAGVVAPPWLRIVFFANYALVGWSLTLAMLALSARFFAEPNRFVRYAADASYWMYLVHLPLVLLVGFGLAQLALPWPVELGLAHLLVLPALLLSYHLLVRSTWVGVLLNGRRQPRP